MRRIKIIGLGLIFSLFLIGCSSSPSATEEKNSARALDLVRAACEEDFDWELRASLTAKARFLDDRWDEIADAANFQAAWAQIKEMSEENQPIGDYSNQQAEFYLQVLLNYSKFLAECTVASDEEVSDG